MYDTIIIGNGPAGITAAIYLKRFNYNPLVIGKDLGALEASGYIDNFYAVPHIKGSDLILKGIEQAKSFGIDVITDEVVSIEYGANGYIVKALNETFEAKTVLLATGKSRSRVFAKNVKEYEGKGISYCAICDGFFYRGKKLGIVGNSHFMENELEVLKKFTNDITIFTNGLDTNVTEFKVVKDKIVSFSGTNDVLTGIDCENAHYDLDGVFIAIGSANAFSFAKHLGLVMDEGQNIVVNDYQTNIPGIFAAGDIIGGLAQVAKAVGDGANVAMSIKKYLNTK